MPSASRTETFDIDINKFFEAIVDYSSYPQFVDTVSSIEIVKKTKDKTVVEFTLNLIKTFKYVLELKHKRPCSVSWTMISADLFKKNSGLWELEDLGNGQTKVTYSLDLDFKGLVPKMIINKLVTNNLPSMMKAYYQRAKEL